MHSDRSDTNRVRKKRVKELAKESTTLHKSSSKKMRPHPVASEHGHVSGSKHRPRKESVSSLESSPLTALSSTMTTSDDDDDDKEDSGAMFTSADAMSDSTRSSDAEKKAKRKDKKDKRKQRIVQKTKKIKSSDKSLLSTTSGSQSSASKKMIHDVASDHRVASTKWPKSKRGVDADKSAKVDECESRGALGEKKRKRVSPSEHAHSNKKRNRESSREDSATNERNQEVDDVASSIDSSEETSLKSRNSFSLMTEIKKNEHSEKSQKPTVSKLIKRSSSSSSSSKNASLTKTKTPSDEKKPTNRGDSINIQREVGKKETLTTTIALITTLDERVRIIEGTENPSLKTNLFGQESELTTPVPLPMPARLPSPAQTSTDTTTNTITTDATDADLLVLVDFELTFTNKRAKKLSSASRSFHDAELELMSDILPIIGCKITNLNVSDYMQDNAQKYAVVDCHAEFLQRIVSQTHASELNEFKAKLFEAELAKDCDDKQADVLADLRAKVELMQRICTECLTRLDLQKAYLEELSSLFLKLSADVANYVARKSLSSSEESKASKSFYLSVTQKLRKRIFQVQSRLVNYAVGNKQNEKFNLVNGLSFFFLFQIMERFTAVYDL